MLFLYIPSVWDLRCCKFVMPTFNIVSHVPLPLSSSGCVAMAVLYHRNTIINSSLLIEDVNDDVPYRIYSFPILDLSHLTGKTEKPFASLMRLLCSMAVCGLLNVCMQ
jgi:hypothetical protein